MGGSGGGTRFVGQGAAPGLAEGPLVRLSEALPAAARTAGAPDAEAAALRDAIAGALKALDVLAERSGDSPAAEMLGFQMALLDDPALTEGAFASIAAGVPAERAWSEALDAEIAGYEAADDAYFRARAADLADLRDRVLAALGGAAEEAVPPGAIVLARDLGPSRFLAADWSAGGGIALEAGSPSAHVAMLARARGVPMVVMLGPVEVGGAGGGAAGALLDGGAGTLVVDPDADARQAHRAAALAAQAAAERAETYRLRPAATADGSPVAVLINVGDPAELDRLDPAMCDGIGLVRTEFLFHGDGGLPDEEAQFAAYRRIVTWAAGRPVTLRTLDAGGDKPIPGVTRDGESNPFLGVRGLRLSLQQPALFRVQLRAMARAAALGPVKVMVPMVTVPAELDAARRELDAAVAELAAAGTPHGRPPLGMMVEVPAAALGAARFAADFYSIGSNDLTQYTMAAARDIGAVAALNDAGDPAVLELIARTVAAGRSRGVEVSLCGDAGGDPRLVPALLDQGLRALSVAPPAVGRVKAAIAACRVAPAAGATEAGAGR